jgi:hypothetical protein
LNSASLDTIFDFGCYSCPEKFFPKVVENSDKLG